MRIYLLLLCLLCQVTWAEPLFEPSRTHAVIVGVLQWDSTQVRSFSKDDRKDQELYDTLIGKGVPAGNITLLLDEEATLEGMWDAVHQRAKQAKPGDTLIFYYAGHGVKDSSGVSFLNYDQGQGMFRVSHLTPTLKQHFRGQRLLLFADCCYSGALGEVAQTLSAEGISSASLTSTTADHLSQQNWTFTQTLLDALNGYRAADRDQNGQITLGETAAEVRDALQFSERQPHGQALGGLPEELVLAATSGVRTYPEELPPPFRLYDYVQVWRDEQWNAARLVGIQGEEYITEFQRYSDREEVRVTRKSIRPIPQQPILLASAEATELASVGGKYGQLLHTIEAPEDYLNYLGFNDFGYDTTKAYLGEKNLGAGFWVYVYPRWYIWKFQVKPSATEESSTRSEPQQ